MTSPRLCWRAGALVRAAGPRTVIEGRRQDILVPESRFRSEVDALMRHCGDVRES